MKIVKRIMAILLVVLGVIMFAGIYMLRDRHPRYQIDIQVQPEEQVSLSAGFAKRSINPTIVDTWRDVNDDGRFDIDQGDFYYDENGNDKFDGIYMAGFQSNRPATGIHDSLWARAMVLQVDTFTFGIVVIDAIGFMHDHVVDVRNIIEENIDIDHVIITSTHTHEAPDLIGMWGPTQYTSGVNKEYEQWVIDRTALAVIDAYRQLEPSYIKVAQDLKSANPLVQDTRQPTNLDIGVRIMQFISEKSNNTLGAIFSWANHPETLWSRNYEITSDFPHYVRTFMEEGFTVNDSVSYDGIGGVCLYVNGAVGGLMTTTPRFGIEDIRNDSLYLEPSFAKAEAQGLHLAKIGLDALQASDTVREGTFSFRAKTLHLPVANKNFRMGIAFGILDRGLSGWISSRSELAIWQFGPISMLHQPGELYPEILNGGVEHPEGADYDIAPVEDPPLRVLMPGKYKFCVGLSSDMIGYIIPKSEWDAKPPYLYGDTRETYGEVNSLGPETAPILYHELTQMMHEIW